MSNKANAASNAATNANANEKAGAETTSNANAGDTTVVTTSSDKTEATPSAVVSSSEPTRKAKVIQTHSCHIGGTDFNLTEGDEVRLPVGAATILQEAGIILIK